ncbi:uncharacterized protein LOC110383099 [Helicoverpa armigera]|uniref:uncharacterized protein LOC110383099 n=1 Tax=Helicoverpa armigera TaxID=29058 RepID=UPI00308379A2
MCYVCCKELKGWCNSFTRAEGLLSLLEAIFLVVFFSFFIFLILHFVACPTYPEGITEEHPKITEATTSTIVVVTTASYPPITGAFTGAESSSSTGSTGSTSTLPPDVECTWEASRQTSAGTHYYLTTEPRSSRRQTDTPSTRYVEDEDITAETLDIFNSTLKPPHDYDDDQFVEPVDGEPADDTYKSQVVALVKLKPLGDVTFGCILTKVTKFWTLTAASCIESIEEVDSLDSFVMIEQFGEAAASRPRGVADVRVHPQFRAAGRSREHDLAALRAHRALRAGAAPRLPALPDYFLVAIGERFHILGYGGFRSSAGDRAARRLRQAAVFALAGGACGAAGARHLAGAGAARHGACGAAALCAGLRWARGAGCGYCAGTPLLRAGKLFGVMSDAGGCGVTCEPQLYVNMATLRDWIDAVTID